MKHSSLSKKDQVKKKRNILFLVFVLISFVFWFLIKLSKTYAHTLEYNIEYVSLPFNKIFQETPQEKIKVRASGTGFSLIRHQITKPTLQLKLSRLRHSSVYTYYLTHEDVLSSLKKQNSNNSTNIVDVFQDTLFIKLGVKKRKKIPVVFDNKITYKMGYKTFNSIQLTPDSIVVEGPELQLSNINSVKTELLQLKDLNENYKGEQKLVLPVIDKVNFLTDKVDVNIPVEKITENVLELPVEVINVPKGLEVVVYPKKVKVSYQIRLSEFNQIQDSDFKVVCDFLERGKGSLYPKVLVTSKKVSEVKLQTPKIEYLIVK